MRLERIRLLARVEVGLRESPAREKQPDKGQLCSESIRVIRLQGISCQVCISGQTLCISNCITSVRGLT